MPSIVKTLNTSPSFLIKPTPPPWARKRLWHHKGFRTQQQVLPWRSEHYFFLICPQVEEAAQQHLCQTAVLLFDENFVPQPDTAPWHRAGSAQESSSLSDHHDAPLSSGDLLIDPGIPRQLTNPRHPFASSPEKPAFESACWFSEDIALSLLQVIIRIIFQSSFSVLFLYDPAQIQRSSLPSLLCQAWSGDECNSNLISYILLTGSNINFPWRF